MEGFAGRIGVTEGGSGDGRARLALEADEGHLNPAGTVHGGVLATLLDAAMGLAVRSVVDDGTPATSQLTTAYLRPGRTGRLVATASVRQRGKALLVCEAEVQQEGEAVATALATFALVAR
jgi:uncharacterized protein (TIGR00369 family)